MKKNNKGFTLVELLAVIVILAIIMVIAVMSINEVINASRAKAFNETMNVIVANAKVLFGEGELPLVEAELKDTTDIKDNEYDFEVEYINEEGKEEHIVITLYAKGKFKNIKWEELDDGILNIKYNYSYTQDDETPYIYVIIDSNGAIKKINTD